MAGSPNNQTKQHNFDIVIVGAGVAGTSAAYHLHQNISQNEQPPSLLILDAAPTAGQGTPPRHSGTATMPVAPCVKMMVQIFAGSSGEFMKHHGHDGARRYLQAADRGLQIQKAIAGEIWKATGVSEHMKELGSYYITDDTSQESALREEYETLQDLILPKTSGGSGDAVLEWCDRERLAQVPGMSKDFHCGIYFPKDAVIDSSGYVQKLLQHVLLEGRCDPQSNGTITTKKPNVQFWSNSRVVKVQECNSHGKDPECHKKDPFVLLTLESGDQIKALNVVMATGGLNQDLPDLNGLLKPCYSYLVHVPIQSNNTENDDNTTSMQYCEFSPNFFTWGFSHDWCFTNGKIRCSGEDHFSAYKAPKIHERCARLSQWTLERYGSPQNDNTTEKDDGSRGNVEDFPQQYGVYSETPDMAPLIGRLSPNRRICYLLGCNASGQTILSYCASLVPGLLGLRDLSEEEKDCLELLSIQRFSNLPAYK